MEFRQLRYFVSVATCSSFTKASAKLHIAQPALSRHLQLLEEEFGVKLLVRTPRGVEMTEAGRRLKEKAEFLLRYADDIKGTLAQASTEPVGRIVIGLPPSLASLLAPRLLDEASRQYPKLTIRIIEGLSVFLADWLEQGRIDLAVLTDYGPIPGIERHDVIDEDLVFICAPHVVAPAVHSISLGDAAGHPLIITHGFRDLMDPWFQPEHIKPDYIMELDSIVTVKEMIVSRAYCTIMSYAMVHAEVEQGLLRALRLEGPPIRRNVITAVKSNRPVSLAMTAVEALIKQELGQMPLRLPRA